jgi:hypothetical protein
MAHSRRRPQSSSSSLRSRNPAEPIPVANTSMPHPLPLIPSPHLSYLPLRLFSLAFLFFRCQLNRNPLRDHSLDALRLAPVDAVAPTYF